MTEMKSDEQMVERCAEAVHKAYCKNYFERNGKPYWTNGDYSRLDEQTKEIDRVTVRAVLSESELLPKLNAMEKENEYWRKEAERFQWLYGQMNELDSERRAEIKTLRDKNYTTMNDYREEVKMRLDAEKENEELKAEVERLDAVVDDHAIYAGEVKSDYQALRTRFDNMVRELKTAHMNCGEDSDVIQSIITKYESQ